MEEDLRHLKVRKLRELLGSHQDDKTLLTTLTFPEDTVLTVPSAPAPYLKLDLTSRHQDSTTAKKPFLSPHHLKGKDCLYLADLSDGQKLTGEGAVKDAYLVKVGLEKSAAVNMALDPGDAIEIICGNPIQEGETKQLLTFF